MIRLLAILAYLAQPVFAQSYPDLFDVRAVADDDILNVRQISSADASIISTLAPKATEIEVVTLSGDGRWGMIGLAEGNGWVSMTYMARRPSTDVLPITCFGTEPFWTLSIAPQTATFDALGDAPRNLTVTDIAEIPIETFVTFTQGLTPIDQIVNIRRGSCNDGMSNREFGFQTSISSADPVGDGALRGCCTLQIENSVLEQ